MAADQTAFQKVTYGLGIGQQRSDEVWGEVRKHVPVQKRGLVLVDLMNIFASHDCDTLDEVVNPASNRRTLTKPFASLDRCQP